MLEFLFSFCNFSTISKLTMADNLLHKWFPTTQLPLIISAPMFTVANGAMAAAVTQAGGLGRSIPPPSPALLHASTPQNPND